MRARTVGILETGVPPASLRGEHGSYATMIEALLGPNYVYRIYHVAGGTLPGTPDACDAYVITGSPAGVYDPLPWIAPLTAFLQAAKGKAKLIGICFGHQIMAQAFGGTVRKSEKGWGQGLHAYTIDDRAAWIDEAATIAIPVSHQDQVITPPPGAHAVGGSAFTPNGVLAYDDQPAISFQCHPEFSPAFAAALLEQRRDRLGDALTAEALASLAQPHDCARVGDWMRRFIDS